MIDPKEILNACSNAHQYGQSAGSTMAQPFLDSIPTMSTASSSNASNVIDGVLQVGSKMMDHMSKIKASIDQQVMVHQDNQQRQKTYDFNVDMRDLRPTTSVGFPQEMASDFFKPYRTAK
ncbi:hypothetical protein WK39_22240 [Burkholderia cepacia]|uniref:DUF6277 family protein n=1 Tax=Burkholderia cepacia TaxID=292 RepID=UPI00075D55E0|nr:DUF6277 family protein [Burkholderia cepacia]KVS54934.1 hypothetical protein WK39_22240 [Burkholderia cepacia]KVS74515.1 hypothetical protein WK40_36770 [Burkholderia cepacia]RQT71086.1 hypothetical protein DF023_38120 [Burkholderia cepacia]RQT91812.1 hypothetical protein DF022_38155 [Burkholderia cepacia]RQZ67679.1 hypothetical protein DF056_38370 [Burkholderia cepacia]